MIGKTLGHYRIVEKIGAGGMGVVYRARDLRLDRDVALKVLPGDALADETARSHLLHEARTASALNHPHICTIYEVGEADGQLYIAMEYVEGKPLSTLLGTEGLPGETVARYGTQIADALAHAHEHGIVHRDLKSANVVITAEGRAKVLDFGLAKRTQEELGEVTKSRVSLEGAGGVAGTLPYLAPEVLRGAAADARSDLWALGVVLYEAATGRVPFRGPTGFELTSAILRDAPPPLPPHVPATLGPIIHRCLAKEPGQRYHSAGEVRAALETAQSSAAVVLPVARPRAISRGWLAVPLALIAVAAVLLGFNVGGWRDRLLGGARPAQIESVAVLPLSNLSGDPQQEYFVDGMTEALITELSKVGALRVISRTSVMQYKGVRKPLPQIAKELNVDAVVEGSVLRADGRVRITAQLIHAATDRHLWAENYERDLRDILALQSEVAGAIVGEIRVQLTQQEQARLAAVRPVNAQAHQAYLKGRYFANKGIGREAVKYFQQAIAADPNYAPPYAGLANSFVFATPGIEFMPKAKQTALKALELDEALPEAHAALGLVKLLYEWDWAGAERAFQRALQLDPSNAETRLRYSSYLAAMGRVDDAIAEARRAQKLDPLSPFTGQTIGRYLQFKRQHDQAIEEYKKTLELDPNFRWSHLFLSFAYEEKGMYEQWVAEQKQAWILFGAGPGIGERMEKALRQSGYQGALRELIQFHEDQARRGQMASAALAIEYAKLGDKERALYWLEKAYEGHTRDLIYLNVEPKYDPIRSDPRFQAIVRRIGLP